MKIILFVFFGLLGSMNNPAELVEKEVVIAESKVEWTGYKVLGNHTGELRIKTGSLDFEGDMLTGGSFEIDMSTISCTDLDGDSASNLVGHLSSPDFFNIAEFPSANFNITKVVSRGQAGDYKIVGDLTIKGITKSISFNTMIKDNIATASTTIDRTDFDVKYGSGSFFDGLGDKTIYDEFDIAVTLTLK